MSTALAPHIKAPSTCLLRFLRSQADNPEILIPFPSSILQYRLHNRATKRNPLRFRKCFGTSCIRQATPHSSDLTSYFSTKASRICSQQNSPIDFNAHFYPPRDVTKNPHSSGEPWSLLSRLPGFSARRKTPSLKAPQTPPMPSFLDDVGSSLVRPKAMKGASDPKLRCTEIDITGKLKRRDARFSKTDFISKFGLLPRDLRKIDSSVFPSILVRPGAILINLLHHRLLIKHDRVIVFDADGTTDSHVQSLFIEELKSKLSQESSESASSKLQQSPIGGSNTLPYEFRALEAVLMSVSTGLESEFEIIGDPVIRVVRDLEEDIDRDKLRHLLIYSKRLGTFEQKARLVRDAIDDLLDADDDLVAMYLTERATGNFSREENDHTEVEMLLETYQKLCDEIVEASGNLINSIRNTEEIVKAILDANRNSLMLLDLKFSIGTLGIGSGAFIASLYGMNLKNFIEESDYGFLGVTGASAIFAAVVCGYGMKKLRRVQRVSMWGEGMMGKNLGGTAAAGSRGSWADLGTGAGVLKTENRQQRLQRAREERRRLC